MWFSDHLTRKEFNWKLKTFFSVQKCAILMLQIDKQHVWLMEWASEWVTGWASEWMNEWTNGWIGWDGVDSNGWSVQRVWGNGNQCNVYADAGTWDPKIGGPKTGTRTRFRFWFRTTNCFQLCCMRLCSRFYASLLTCLRWQVFTLLH